MKEKIHYVIEAVLVVAVVILFVFQFSDNKKPVDTVVPESESMSKSAVTMAYIDIDSLMTNYTYSVDLNEQLMKKSENTRATLTVKARKLEADAQDFQRKAQTGSFLSEERMMSERDRIMKSEEDYRTLEQKLAHEFTEEQIRISEELRNTIVANLREYNKDKKYLIIHGKMNDNILYGDESCNITAEVISFLNMKYAASPVVVAK